MQESIPRWHHMVYARCHNIPLFSLIQMLKFVLYILTLK